MANHVYVNKRNSSGCLDLTAQQAIINALEGESTDLDVFEADKAAAATVHTIKHMLDLAGFELIDKIGIRHKQTGRDYWRQ